MKLLPRIRLRTLFVIVFCAAVGLSIGTAPTSNFDPLIQSWQVALKWQYALLGAGSVAFVIGLMQEVVRIRSWNSPEISQSGAAAFAKKFAMLWRIAIAGLLVVCLIAALLLSRGLATLPESEVYNSYDIFPYGIWVLCLIVVLSATLSKRRPISERRPSTLHVAIVAGAAIVLGILVLPNVGLIPFLAHIATAGLENAQPAVFRRPGEFPDHSVEGFRSFWISASATAIVVFAVLVLVWLATSDGNRRWLRVLGIVSIAVLICAAVGYCTWYYGHELHRISPYLAATGFGSSVVERIAGVVLAIILITAAAYDLSTVNAARFHVAVRSSGQSERIPIYESMSCLFLIAFAAAIYLVELLSLSMAFGMWPGADMILWMFQDPCTLLMLSLLILCLRLCWLKLRKVDRVESTIIAIDSRLFLWCWIAVAAIVCVGIPAVSAFVFVFWLGPWYLYGQ